MLNLVENNISFRQDAFLSLRELAWQKYLKHDLHAKHPLLKYFKRSDILKSYDCLSSTRELKAQKNEILFLNGELVDHQCESLMIKSFKEVNSPFLQSKIKKQIEDEEDPFALINLASFSAGVQIGAPPNTQCAEPIKVVFIQDKPGFSAPLIHLNLLENASLNLKFESQGEPSLFLLNTLVSLDSFAELKLYNLMDAPCFESLRASLKKESLLETYQIAMQNQRLSSIVSLVGERAQAKLYGIDALQNNAYSHIHVLMKHYAPYTESTQLFKSVLKDESLASFDGKIWIDKEAQKVNAYQLHKSTLLSEKAKSYSLPNLEIFADDVKASHGATVGRLDQEALFYLSSRGIKGADALLIKAFLQEIIHLMDHFSSEASAKLGSFFS
jgi:Fe-S cluster assembly protein SufD